MHSRHPCSLSESSLRKRGRDSDRDSKERFSITKSLDPLIGRLANKDLFLQWAAALGDTRTGRSTFLGDALRDLLDVREAQDLGPA